ncbi:hypothetical protein BDM02DRAFT_3267097 [Thelephora ganbajun]|uniref:Uncharacterized protein n=1 Tax=Thelephora ganbajun TaxID=370292 RepID=A0ACB6ZPX1_THEGA|nr:hypothetical protein BDM02DRAFT_3267097 [Thelephora ganbajun]
MPIDNKGTNNGLRSLTWYCQRVAINHLDSICSVEGLPFPLIKCILEACSADTLLRLEQASPTIQSETNEVWRKLCENTYKQFWSDYELRRFEEPKSWKATFFELRVQEAEKFRQLGAKLRSQRAEHEERRKEKEVKYSGLLPPPKRQRTSTWGQSSAPKTLFEKARSKTAQIQKGVYAATRILPPMPQYKNYSTMLPPRTVSAKPLLPTSRPAVTIPVASTLLKITAPALRSQMSLTTSAPSPASSSSSPNRSSSSIATSIPSSTPSTSPTPSTPATTPSPIPQSGIITVTKIMVPKPAPRTSPPLDTVSKRQRYMDPVLPQLARKYARREAVMRERGLDKPSSTSTITQTIASGSPTPKPPPSRKPDTVLFMPRHRASSQLPSRPTAR